MAGGVRESSNSRSGRREKARTSGDALNTQHYIDHCDDRCIAMSAWAGALWPALPGSGLELRNSRLSPN